MNETIYPLSKIEIKEEYSPYKRYEELPGGKRVILDVPNRYDIKFDCYDLIPGVSLILDEASLKVHREGDSLLTYENESDNLLIHYFLEGQCQLEVGPDKYIFIKNNDINLYIKNRNPYQFSYNGEMKIIHIIINKKQMEETLEYYNIEYYHIVKNLFDKAKTENNTVFKSPETVTKIIHELMNFNSKNELSHKIFYQLKICELLLELYEYNFTDEKPVQRTYSDAQIRVVRTIKNSLSRNIASYVSLDQVALSYGMNLTTLKNCFKDMYGKPLYTWYKEYKFYRARELIKNTDYPISKIANMIGYKSSSKFAKAFKKEMGVLPSSYRKNKK